MKKLIFCLLFFVGTTAFANNDIQPLSQKEVKLIKALKQIDPEMLDAILSDAGVE